MNIIRLIKIILYIVILLVLVNCNQPADLSPTATLYISAQPTYSVTSYTSTETIAITKVTDTPTITLSSKKSITPTVISSPAPAEILPHKCLEVGSIIPIGEQIQDRLVLLEDVHSIKYLDLATGVKTQLDLKNINGSISIAFTSPNGKWLAFIIWHSNPQNNILMVISADGKQRMRIPWWVGVNSGLVGWLDNDHLIFLRGREPASTIVFNPFKGVQEEILLDYMDQIPSMAGLYETYFGSSNILPDPTLKLLVYPQNIQGQLYVTLWDRATKKPVAQLGDLTFFDKQNPLWSVDGKDFVYAVMRKFDFVNDKRQEVYDWFQVSREGSIRQLTHFEDSLSYARILDGSRSPDGRYVAFWLEELSDKEPGKWYVLDIEKESLLDFCIQSTIGNGQEPLWSPDGRYFIIQNVFSNGDNPAILVDLEHQWAAQVTENTFVTGWLAGS